MISLTDPTLPGQFSFKRVVYATPELNYLQTPDLQNHCLFEHPTPGYETKTVNLSAVVNFDYEKDFPFYKEKTPINAILCVPEGKGPFPVVVFTHGNFTFNFISAPGYLYLCDLLASHGILAATLNVSFLNSSLGNSISGQFGEIAGRAILVLEHLKQFQAWNKQEAHPLYGKINLKKCMLVGHSFGGEAVGQASLFNQKKSPIQFYNKAYPVAVDGSQGLGPYGFGIQAVIALAPTDQLYRLPEGATQIPDNYLVIHGSRDQSVVSFPGQLTYDRSHRVNTNNSTPSGFKSLLWIHKANHNFFNSLWQQDSKETITREQQERIAKVYVSALAQAMLQDRKEYLQLLQNHQFGIDRGWLPQEITFISQFQSLDRLLIQHFEEPDCFPQISAPVEGKVSYEGIRVQVQPLSRPSRDINNKFFNHKSQDRKYHLYQDTRGLKIDWTEPGGRYVLTLSNTSLQPERFEFLSFSVGQSFEPNNLSGQAQDFTLVVHDETQSVRLSVSRLQSLPHPDLFPLSLSDKADPVTVLQTVFLSLEQLRWRGLNPSRLTKLEFVFDITPSGTVYINDIQLTNLTE